MEYFGYTNTGLDIAVFGGVGVAKQASIGHRACMGLA